MVVGRSAAGATVGVEEEVGGYLHLSAAFFLIHFSSQLP
jgi:hypothetical protein